MIAGLLERALRAPSRRWSLIYLGASVGGYLLTTYATSIADKLAPEPPALDDTPFDVMKTADLQPMPDDHEYLDVETPAEACASWCVLDGDHSGACRDEFGRMGVERGLDER